MASRGGGGGKRKRGDRTFSGDGRDDGSRPSPHRPGNLPLGQQSNYQQGQQQQNYGGNQYDQRGGGRRRGSRGGRGGGPQHSPMNSPNTVPLQSRINNASPKAMSPTITPRHPPVEPQKDTVPRSPTLDTTAPQPVEEQPTKPMPYYYEYLKDDMVANWNSTRRSDVVASGIGFCANEDAFALGLYFQELVRSAVDGRLDATDAGLVIKDVLEEGRRDVGSSDTMVEEDAFNASSLFLDCLSVFAEASSAPPTLQRFVQATGISPLQMRHELDSGLLESLGMIRNTFVRMGIRQQTNLLYRQSNYNLLREETEGYSKLLTELFTTSSNEPSTSEVVEETFERVKGMIGAFDLDVGRVLDVTLDVFAAVLVKQYRFFVKYLRASSWWPQDKPTKDISTEPTSGPLPRWALPGSTSRPLSDEEKEAVSIARSERDHAFWIRSREIGTAAFFELGGRQVADSTLIAATEGESSQDDEGSKWIEITKTLPPPGNKVAAQVLGFKLRFYSSNARDPADVLPVNLIYLAALLIKIGFISLRDLYPHIWPADQGMESVRDEKIKEKLEREKLSRPGGGAANALLAAAPLPDDTPEGKMRESTRMRELDAARRTTTRNDQPTDRSTPAAQPEEKEEPLPEPSEQKVQLLKSLLCIGAIPEALYILGRFPWLPDAFPELPEHIHRILHHSLSKVYESLRPLKDQAALREVQKIPDPDQSAAGKGQIKLIDGPARKTMRWAQLDKEDTNEAIDYKFYWDDWADNVPICHNTDDVFTLCFTLLNYSGVKIGQDTALLIKLARIGIHSLATDTSETNMARWIDLSKRLLVPALSFTKCNPGVVNEVFELIKSFSTATRYSIYAEWYSGQISRLPDMKSAFDQAKAETKDVLKRMSKTTIKPMARALAKVAYANPGIVFSVAIAQLESYDNIVDAVVECARYFTFLAYDVLTWSLLSALGGRGRNRVQADGMLTSKWLAALSLFAGKVFKRYSILNPTPVIQYVADQLLQGNSTDLIVLEEIIKSMAGIISDTNFNEAQVQAMAGGELLQAQTLLQLLDRRHESKTTAKRLMRSLTDSKLAGQMLVSLAQERQTGIFRIEEQDAHPKLLGNIFDQLHRVLAQYMDLLRSNLSVKDFDVFVPGVAQLIIDFGVDPSVAFWISRPSIAAAIAEYDAKNGKRNSDVAKSPLKEITEEIVASGTEPASDAMTLADKAVETPNDNAIDQSLNVINGESKAVNGDVDLKDSNEDVSNMVPPNSTKVESVQQPWHPILQDIMNAVRPMLSDEMWDTLSLPFFVKFWSLALSDIYSPVEAYNDEMNRQKKKLVTINNDRSDVSIAGTKRKEKDREALNDLQDRLSAEKMVRMNAFISVRRRLLKDKDQFFAGLWGKWDALNVALIERCFFPRAIISPIDALYSFKMLSFLHTTGAPNFRTMGVLDQIFREKKLTSLMFLCTAREAENLGRFLYEILHMLSLWHADKKLFEKEAFGSNRNLPGFTKKLSTDKTQYTFLEFEDFRRLVLKWHRSLNAALKNCIGSGEYMHIRNAVNVLNQIHQHFPAVNWMGISLLGSITDLSKKESREDLKVAGLSLMGALKRREKDWVMPQAFSLAATDSGASNAARAASAKPSTPRPDSETAKNLNPKASEFQPTSQSTVKAAAKVEGASGKADAEDGEIEDAKMTDAPLNHSTDSKTELPRIVDPTPKDVKPPTESLQSAGQDISRASPRASPASNSMNTANNSPRPPRPDVKATPPTTSHHNVPPARPDINRSASSGSAPARPQHTLPSKPEQSQMRIGDHRLPPRTNDLPSQEHARDSRHPERGEPRDLYKDRGPDRRGPGAHPHGHDGTQQLDRDQRWTGERPAPSRSAVDDFHAGPHARDSRPPPRDDRSARLQDEKSYFDQLQGRREPDITSQPSRDSGMPPPRSNIPQHPINPERAALIHGGPPPDRSPSVNIHPDRRPESLRPDGHSYTERHSRGSSPSGTHERRPPRYEGRRDDRPPVDGRRSIDDRGAPPRFEESHAPTGPRTGRQPNTGPAPSNQNDRFRESMKPMGNAASIDPNHGRLSQDSSFSARQTESQYGRLNSDNDIPSGPRMANGNHPPPVRGNRNVSAPQPQLNTQLPRQNQGPPTPIQDRQAPSGPGMRGSPHKSGPFPHNNATSSAPPTPVAQSPDTGGIHPDRLRALQGSGVIAPDNQNAPNIRGTRQDPPPVSIPPRGPHSNQMLSPIGPPPNSRGPPTGPAMPNDRSGRDKRTFAGIQNVLQQANTPAAPERSGQGASIRGRGGRANNVNGPSPVTSGPPTPIFPRQDQPSRDDLFGGRPNGPPPTQQPENDTMYGRGGNRHNPRDGPRDGDRRSSRHRSRSPGKGGQAGGPHRMHDENYPPQGRENVRDRPRGNEGPPDLRGSPSGPNEANIRGTGGPHPPSERGGYRRSGRKEEQYRERDEHQRDDRDRRDGGRKRARGGDEGQGQGERGFVDTKRPRR